MNTAYAIEENKNRISCERKVKPYIIDISRGISRLERLGQIVSFPKKHTILEAGEYTKYCYVIKKGRVLTYESYANGEERIYHFHEKNSLFLESNLLFQKPAAVSFRAATMVELIRIDRNTLMHALREDSQLALDLIESAYNKFESSMDQVRHMRNYSINWKLCDMFLSFADYYGIMYDGKVFIKEKISQQLMSSMLGVNRITIVRGIKELKELGLLGHSNGFYFIYDVEALKEYQKSVDKNQ